MHEFLYVCATVGYHTAKPVVNSCIDTVSRIITPIRRLHSTEKARGFFVDRPRLLEPDEVDAPARNPSPLRSEEILLLPY